MTRDKSLDEYASYKWICTPLIGKAPMLKKWNQFDHTPDRSVFSLDRNIGILCGRVSGITVLDIDVKDAGLDIWKKIECVYPSFMTPTVRTPSGGLHLYFKYERSLQSSSRLIVRRSASNTKIGWDILNDDRQAVAPPSRDVANGKQYKWIISPAKYKPIRMPKWLLNYIKLSSK